MSSAIMRTARAVIWFTRIQEGSMSRRRLHQLQRWLAIPANREEFESARAAWQNTPSTQHAERLVSRPCAEPTYERARLASCEAAYWYIRCADEVSLSKPDRRAFMRWLRQSVEHVAEFFKMVRLDGKLRRRRSELRSTAAATSNVIELATAGGRHWPRRAIHESDEHADGPVTNTRAIQLKVAAAAATILLGAPLAYLAHHYLSSKQVVATGAGQWDRMLMSDGTVVHIDARSRVETKYTEHARIVHLHEGSAVFDVAKDAGRPFVVTTGFVEVVAVGTRFGVSLDAGVTTTVAEGVVKVVRHGRGEGIAVMLKAGEELHIPDDGPSQVAHVDAERKLQWARTGLLDLGGMTIAEAVAQLNRRNQTQIVVESATLGAEVVDVANVRMDSPVSYARIVAGEPGVTMIEDKNKDLIRLSK